MGTLQEEWDEMRERAAELEHLQWMEWSQQIAATEKISPDRMERWKKLWVPYSELTEEQKDQDRKWADRGIEIYSSFAVNV